MAVERIEFSQSPTGGDLAGFHQLDNSTREQDLQSAMMGQEHQDGGRHDLEARGFTSDATGEEAFVQFERDRLREQALHEQPQEHTYSPQYNPQGDNSGQNFQRLYGQSENEKGALRQALQEQMNANQALLAQINSMRPPVQAPSFNNNANYGQQVPNQYPTQGYNTGNMAQQPAQPQYQLPTRIVDKVDGEMILAEDLEGVIRDKIAPVVMGLYNQVEQSNGRAAQLEEQLFNSEKARRGITPQLEQLALNANPWLQSIGDRGAYLNALQATINVNQQASSIANGGLRPLPQSQGNGSNGTSNTLRRLTYSERGGGNTNSHIEVNQDQQRQLLWNEAMKHPYGSQARIDKMNEFFKASGIQRTAGYRDPSVLSQ